MFVIDKSAEKLQSEWFDYHPEWLKEKVRLKIKPITDKKYQIARENAETLARAKGFKFEDIEKGTNNVTIHELIVEATSFLVEDWEGLAYINAETGKQVQPKFTREELLNILIYGGKTGIELGDFILAKANEIQSKIAANRETVLGKSSTSTNGSNSEKKPKNTQKSKPTSANG